MQWLVDGYNVIRSSPELASCERAGLEAGRQALCRLLADAARVSGDRFVVVFDGTGGGGAALGAAGVQVIFSSARESADQVLARLAAQGGAVVSNDREVQRAAARRGAIPVKAGDFLARLAGSPGPGPDEANPGEKDEEPDRPPGPRKGNPRRPSKRERAARRALGRLSPPGGASRAGGS